MTIFNFMWMWKNFGYWFFSWCMKRPYIFMQLSSTEGFGGLPLLMECEGWIGKLFSVRWAWGKMRSVFLHHLTLTLPTCMYLLAEENKAICSIQGSAHLPLDHSALNRFEYYSTWVIFWCGFYRWGRSCAKQIKKVCQTDRKRSI